jgi:Family of unknown function (DUF6178)
MTTGNGQNKPDLTLIRGGKASIEDFASLPLDSRIFHLREVPARKRQALILGDPDGKLLTHALPPDELYWTIREIGVDDALDLLKLASPEQREFMLDMELWEGSSFSLTKALEWLAHLVDAGEETVAEQLPLMDIELLLALLIAQISVGGGVGDLTTDDERTASWDHSFDNLYYITFKDQKHARLVGSFLDIVHRRDHDLYLTLLEGVKNESRLEMEDEAYHLRTGRLAESGFPPREEAVMIYARIDPGSFVPQREKKFLSRDREADLPVPLRDGSLLARALRHTGSVELCQEFTYLVNNALVADDTPFGDAEAMQSLVLRVSGYLTIALESLCGDDEERATGILERESMKRLFQLGHSIVQGLKKRAVSVTGADYATGKALNGLRAERPRFYRGLDPDGIDGYREFSCLADVRRIEEFLELIAEQ